MDVEQRPSNDNSLTLNLEHDPQNGSSNDSYDVSTAHTIDRGILFVLFSAKLCFM